MTRFPRVTAASLSALAAVLGLTSCNRSQIVDAGGCVSDKMRAYPATATGAADLVVTAKMTSDGKPVVGQLVHFNLLAKPDTPWLVTTSGYTDKDGVARAHLTEQDIRAPYFRDQALRAHLFEAKYEKSLLAASAKHPYCDASDSASLTFR
ncbi:MAG: hypothetical protein QOC82_1165 [Frankiaceae bacterium]|nr:hypothetical protein [Frankiaceae bacterium]